MEAIVLVLALCVLGILATYFGVDCRDRPRSTGRAFGASGGQWDEMPHVPQGVAECQSSVAHQPTSPPEAA